MPTTVNHRHPFNHPDVGQISDNSDRALEMTQDLEKDDNFYYTKRLVDRYWCFRLFICQAECEYETLSFGSYHLFVLKLMFDERTSALVEYY